MELSGVDGLDVGREGEPTGDRGVVVELEALLIGARRDGPEGLPEDAACRQGSVAHANGGPRSSARKRALAPDADVQEPVDRVRSLVSQADVRKYPPTSGRVVGVDHKKLIEAVGDQPREPVLKGGSEYPGVG